MRCDCGNQVKNPGIYKVEAPVVRDENYVPQLDVDYAFGSDPFTYDTRTLCVHCRRDIIKPKYSNDNKQQIE